MDYLSAAILGLIEGLTEFLPVSSTGHLIIVRDLLGIQGGTGFEVDVLLNMAAVLAIVVYFFFDIWGILKGVIRRDRNQTTLFFALILGTIPAVLFGLLFQNVIENSLRSSLYVAAGLLMGSAIFYLAEKYKNELRQITIGRGLIIGFFQALALFPGMSRSGMSISGGLLMGLSREQATRFAFLLSAPIILGAGAKEVWALFQNGIIVSDLMPILLACFVAFVSALFAIHVMLRFVRTHSLMPFIWYRVALALIIIFIAYY